MKSDRSLRSFFITIIFLTLYVIVLPSGRATASDRPNFIFIIVDDLGATDIACPGDGNELDSHYYKTPNIAQLRSRSMRFTDAYVDSPYCKPTRATVMSGKCNQRLKNKNLNGRLAPCETTIAEALDAGGTDYLCASVGKWALGAKDAFPNRQGFDYNYGGSGRLKPSANETHFELGDGIEGWDPNDYPGLGDPDPCDSNEYLADSITTRAIEFLQTAKDSSKPFFLYVAYFSLHKPIEAKDEDFNDVNGWEPDEESPADFTTAPAISEITP